MSGLTRFIGKTDKSERNEHRSFTPPPAQASQSRVNRVAAQNLKFGGQKFDSASAATATAQRLPSTAPAPGYDSNPTAPRNTFTNNRFTAYDPPPYQRDLDEVTVNSDFDVTKSDINFEPAYEDGEDQHEYAGQADQHFPTGMPQHRLHHVHSQSQLVKPDSQQSPPKQQASAIVGRFHATQGPSQHPDLQLRSGQLPNLLHQQMTGSKKRSRSNEHPHELYQQQRHEVDNELEDTDEYDLPDRDSREPRNQLDISSEVAETPASSPTHQRKLRLTDRPQSSQGTKRASHTVADYDDETLKGMQYAELKSEDWDTNPYSKYFTLPAELQGPDVELGDKIKYYAEKRDDYLALFFEQLSTREWEQAGDWLIDNFADLLKQLKQKKQEKRALVEEFEAEIGVREKAVRDKSELLDKKFRDMKASGEDVLRSKMV